MEESKNKKIALNKILLFTSGIIALLFVIFMILTLALKSEALATICGVLAGIALITGGAFIWYLWNGLDAYCPECGCKLRKACNVDDEEVTAVGEYQVRNHNESAKREIKKTITYTLEKECEICGYTHSFQTRGPYRFFEYVDGHEVSTGKKPPHDYDTGFPDNSNVINLTPVQRKKQNKRRLLTYLLCAVLMFGVGIAGIVVAANDNIYYNDVEPSDDGTSNTDNNGTTDVGGNNNGGNVVIDDPDFQVENGVLVDYLGDESEIMIPNGITKISESAFENCYTITKLTIPDSVTTIEDRAFYNCTNLTDVTIGSGVKSIGVGAFLDCINIASIIIPNNVTTLDEGAFNGCINLKTVTIGDGVTSIGSGAFIGCTSLETVSIGTSVSLIEYSAFGNCTSLKSVHIKDIEKWCEISFDGFYANPLYYANNLYINGDLVTNLVIPNSVTTIRCSAFINCTSFTSVTIGNSVTSIDNFVFEGCTNITSVIFTDDSTWYTTYSSTDWENKTGGTIMSVDDASTNARNLLLDYYDAYWYKL